MPGGLSNSLALALALLSLAACATAPPSTAPPAPPAPAAPSLARRATVSAGMDAAALKRAWGDPTAIRRVPSPAAPGLVYERWYWGSPGVGREALLVDGRVVDFLDPGAGAGSAPTEGQGPR